MTRKRILRQIPKIKLPDIDGTSHIILDTKILFIHLAYDDSPSDPLKECDGMGNIEQISSRHCHGEDRDKIIATMYSDHDIVPLRYESCGGQCEWNIAYDHDDIYSSICVERVIRRLRGEDPDDWGTVGFEPEWAEKFDGIWVPDKCTRESYTGQDNLSRRDWMVKQAESACETYTDYCNGSVYGYDIKLYSIRKDDDGEIITDVDYYEHHTAIEEDSCWGYYGWKYFEDEVLGVVKGFLKTLKFSRRAIDAAIKEAA
jgi:hypothetical protein